MRWFDGHLDLTYLALHGRDLTRLPGECGGSLHPASVTFPSLKAGGVRAAVSTLFVRRRVKADAARGVAAVEGDFCFDTPDEAHAAAVRQVEMHRAWEREGWIENAERGMRNAEEGKDENPKIRKPKLETRNLKLETQATAHESRITDHDSPLRVTLALEGAACLRTVEDSHWFYDAGVRVVSLAWAEGSQWAGGDQSGGDVTSGGLELIDRLDALGCVHDVSHLSEPAFWTLMERAKGKIVASHSNCRALLTDAKHPERHLSDQQIRAIVERGGVIGVNLFARFLIPAEELQRRRARIADVILHIQHIEQLAGRRDVLALGSDMDSGFGTDLLPEDLQGPEELGRLAEALAGAGWSDSEIEGFAGQWGEVLQR